MKKLTQQSLPDKLGGFRSFKPLINAAVNQRNAMMIPLSGYPVASHVIDQIQRSLKFDSMKSLLQSLKDLRDLVRLASDVLSTIPLANVSKQQFNRNDLTSYITSNAAALGQAAVTLADNAKLIDLVAYMITSSETPESAWILDMPNGDSNRFLQIQKLYTSLGDADEDACWVYDPESEKIVEMTSLRRYRDMARKNSAAGKEAQTQTTKSAMTNLLMLSHIKVVDHLYCLTNDTHIWDNFLSVRSNPDPSQNVERATSLKIFAAYLHSVLMYFHFWSIEAFMATYKGLEAWVTTFPVIPEHTLATYNNIVRKYDVFETNRDAAELLSCYQQDGANPLGSQLTILPFRDWNLEELATLHHHLGQKFTVNLIPL
jgi:hypothetical protein